MRKHLAWMSALAGAAVILATTAGPASATAGSGHASFAAQARHAVLTSAQIRTLQREVNTFIAEHGGTQAAINEVSFRGGRIVFVVPGERYAHVVTASGPAATGEVCPYQDFCIYQGKAFTGTYVYYYTCNVYNAIPKIFSGDGSWKNDQTPGVRGYFYGSTENLIYTTAPAYANDADYDWAPVYYVVACK